MALTEIENIFDNKVSFLYPYTIDNIVATSKLCSRLDLLNFCQFLKAKDHKVHINTQRFPGACLRLKEGCILLFHSGKIVFAGNKSFETVKNNNNTIKILYNDYQNL